MTSERSAEALERIAKILAGILLKDIEEGDQKQKIKRLRQCGFENTEIAEMLGTTRNTVGVAVHSLKKRARERLERNHAKALTGSSTCATGVAAASRCQTSPLGGRIALSRLRCLLAGSWSMSVMAMFQQRSKVKN